MKKVIDMPNCNECKHLKVDKGDRWTPTTYYCELDLEEESCEQYEYFDYLQYLEDEENRKHDAKLQGWDWREERGDYD